MKRDIFRIGAEYAGIVVGVPVLVVFVLGLYVYTKAGEADVWVKRWIGVEK